MKPHPKKRAIILRKTWPRVRDHSSPEKSLFIVDARPHGRREGFNERQDAMVRAEQLALEIENKGTEAVSFPTENRVLAAECIRLLLPFGKSLRDATSHYVAWLESEKHKNESRLVAACINDYEAAKTLEKERGEFAEKSLAVLKSAMKPLRNALGGVPIMAVTEEKMMTEVAPVFRPELMGIKLWRRGVRW